MDLPDELVRRLRRTRRVAVLTGAGVSAESGVPTFRDAQTGFWAQYRPEDLATREAFRRQPRRVWEWYRMRRGMVQSVRPNAGHVALAQMERWVERCTVVTQNVDGLHQRAGSRRVLELHGNITRVKCFEEDTVVEGWEETGEVPPRCPRCGGWLRPDVVWFGEALPEGVWAEAEAAAREAEVLFSVGTSSVVYPAASLPEVAADGGALVVEVNVAPTPLSRRAGHVLAGLAGEVLPALVAAVWGEEGA